MRTGGLRDALLASWHPLGGPARQLAQLLAVGGRPVNRSILEQLAAARDLPPDSFGTCLGESVAAGIATSDGAEQVWFRHPC